MRSHKHRQDLITTITFKKQTTVQKKHRDGTTTHTIAQKKEHIRNNTREKDR